jgi:hypothetical protein
MSFLFILRNTIHQNIRTLKALVKVAFFTLVMFLLQLLITQVALELLWFHPTEQMSLLTSENWMAC